MCFLRRYGYTAIALNFFLSVIVMVEGGCGFPTAASTKGNNKSNTL